MPVIAPDIITLSEAKAFLRIEGDGSDSLLPSFISTASQMIVNEIGIVSGSPTAEEWHDGGADRIVLRNAGPIVSVTSVIESFGNISYTLTEVDLDSNPGGSAYAFTVDLDEGLLVRRASGVATCFASGLRNIHITYVAGYTTVPADLKHACKVLLKSLWDDSQRAPRGGSAQPTPSSTPGAFPLEVQVILNRYGAGVPGIA